MGGLLCCAAEGACCALSICKCCCSGATGGSKTPSTKLAKIFYLLIIVFSTILTLLLRAYGSHLFVSFYSFHFGCTGGFADRCFGDQAVFRMSFALTAFFLVILLLSASKSAFAGYWGPKFLLYIVFTVGSFFIPNQFYNVYAEISRVVSVLFLLLMVLILVDFSYTLQEWLEDKAASIDDSLKDDYEQVGLCQNVWRILYLVIVIVLLLASMVAIGFMYHLSVKAGSCGGNIGFLSVTIIVGGILVIMSVLQAFGGRGLLCPSIVFGYATWLVWSAMTNNPDAVCNPFGTSDDTPWAVIVGCLVSGFSLAYTSYSAASSAPNLCGGGDEDEHLQSNLLDEDHSVKAHAKTDEDEDEAEVKQGVAANDDDDDEEEDLEAGRGTRTPKRKEALWFYVLIMTTASLYMAMLLSNWGTGSSTGVSSAGHASMWIKIGTQWITFALYFWTLIAPRLCPNREF